MPCTCDGASFFAEERKEERWVRGWAKLGKGGDSEVGVGVGGEGWMGFAQNGRGGWEDERLSMK